MDGKGRARLPAERRRELIEEAGARLFAERGYERTTIEEIAAGAGVTKPIVYRHFASKKALHTALLKRHRDGLLAVLRDVAPGTQPLEARLRSTLEAWFGYVESHPFAWAMLFRDTTGEADLQKLHRELRASARGLTAELLASDAELSVAEEDVEPVAELIRSATTGLALWWLERPELSRTTLVDNAARFLLHGMDGARAPLGGSAS